MSPGRACLLIAMLLVAAPPVAASYGSHPEARRFIDEIAARHRFDEIKLRQTFRRIKRQEQVLAAISRPAERILLWKDYRSIFLTEQRVMAAVEFWRQHRDLLAEVETIYSVPQEIILAVIGVETFFGRHNGQHPALASLVTLAFDYPPRSRFFRGELEQFLLLAREEDFDPLSVNGSYAAAMGMPQFISSSYREYAVDFDGDGKRDLWNNIADICASVANYLSRHGWQAGQPVAERVYPQGTAYRALISTELRPRLDTEQLRRAGIQATRPSASDKALYQFTGEAGAELWLGHKNFYVISRYNHSKLYAMAVLQLSRQIAAAIEE